MKQREVECSWSFWVFFVSRRFLANHKMKHRLLPAALSIAGIAVGSMALIVVLSVMNGFQMGFIDDILEIRSYHLRLSTDAPLSESSLAKLKALPPVRAVVPFREVQTLAAGRFSEYEPVALRGISAPEDSGDTGFFEQIAMISGTFSIGIPGTAVVGSELADTLGVTTGTAVQVVTLLRKNSGLRPSTQTLIVTGVFESGYYEIDSSMAFCSLATTDLISSAAEGASEYGIKLVHRYKDREAVDSIRRAFGDRPYEIVSWREYNRAFFGALRIEKLTMILLLSLIFFVVAFNIGHSLSRSVTEKREAIAVLKALGGTPVEIRTVFVLQGALIGAAGAAIGVSAGLLVVTRIDAFFSALGKGLDAVVRVARLLIRSGDGSGDAFAFFSPSFFYLTSVPVRVLFPELFLTAFTAIVLSMTAAGIASRKLSEIQPQKVLRYE